MNLVSIQGEKALCLSCKRAVKAGAKSELIHQKAGPPSINQLGPPNIFCVRRYIQYYDGKSRDRGKKGLATSKK